MNTNKICIRCGMPFPPREHTGRIPFETRYCEPCVKIRVEERTKEGFDSESIVEKRTIARKRYFVGIRPNSTRAVFYMAVVEPTKEMCPQYNAVIGPFRTKRGAEFMRDHGANNPHVQTVQDAERIAKQIADENAIENQTLYVASCWWRDNDAFCTVAGNSARLVEKTIFKAMRNAAIDEYNNSDSEDKRRVRDYMDDLAWSGVNAFAFDAIVPERIIRQYEESYSTHADTVAHHPDMDYSDYEMLRDGRKDVVVYL